MKKFYLFLIDSMSIYYKNSVQICNSSSGGNIVKKQIVILIYDRCLWLVFIFTNMKNASDIKCPVWYNNRNRSIPIFKMNHLKTINNTPETGIILDIVLVLSCEGMFSFSISLPKFWMCRNCIKSKPRGTISLIKSHRLYKGLPCLGIVIWILVSRTSWVIDTPVPNSRDPGWMISHSSSSRLLKIKLIDDLISFIEKDKSLVFSNSS